MIRSHSGMGTWVLGTGYPESIEPLTVMSGAPEVAVGILSHLSAIRTGFIFSKVRSVSGSLVFWSKGQDGRLRV